MCGYIGYLKDSPQSLDLVRELGIENQLPLLRNNPGTGPSSLIDIIKQGDSGPKVARAIWWLLLEKTEDGYHRPSKYTSFNTRSDKLNIKRSAGYLAFRQSRCIIPATYIIEGEGPKGSRRYHRIEPNHQAFALGGLFRHWGSPDTDNEVLSCSVIVLPPHPIWAGIHTQSTPLFLPVENASLIKLWLDPEFSDTEAFESILQPQFHDQLTCTPIQRPGNQVITGEHFTIN